MTKITLQTSPHERARHERKHGVTKAQRLLQCEINQSHWRWRRKKVWANQVIDLWCSVLFLGVQVHLHGPCPGPEFLGARTVILHFTEEEVLEEMSTVVQIILGAAASQHAVGMALREV